MVLKKEKRKVLQTDNIFIHCILSQETWLILSPSTESYSSSKFQPVTFLFQDSLPNYIREAEQQDTNRLQTRLSSLLSEQHCSLEGTMGKGQEKGGSIVSASCWMWLTLAIWPEVFFFSLYMIFWKHPLRASHLQYSITHTHTSYPNLSTLTTYIKKIMLKSTCK